MTPKTSTALNAAPSWEKARIFKLAWKPQPLEIDYLRNLINAWLQALLDLIPVILLYWVMGLFLTIATRLAGLDVPLPVWAELLVELYLPALAYGVLLVRFYSASAGKRFLGIQVVRSDGSRVGWGRAFVRELVKFSPLFPVVVFDGGSENR